MTLDPPYRLNLTTEIHSYNTRTKYVDINKRIPTRTLFIPTARTTQYGLKLTKVLGPKIWYHLPSSLKIQNLTFYIPNILWFIR